MKSKKMRPMVMWATVGKNGSFDIFRTRASAREWAEICRGRVIRVLVTEDMRSRNRVA